MLRRALACCVGLAGPHLATEQSPEQVVGRRRFSTFSAAAAAHTRDLKSSSGFTVVIWGSEIATLQNGRWLTRLLAENDSEFLLVELDILLELG